MIFWIKLWILLSLRKKAGFLFQIGFSCIQKFIVRKWIFPNWMKAMSLCVWIKLWTFICYKRRFHSHWIFLFFNIFIVRTWIIQNVSSKSIQMYFTIVLVWNQNGYGGVLVCMYVCLFMAVCDECGLYVKMSVCSKCPMYSLPCYPHFFLPAGFPSRFSIAPCQI